MQYLISFAFILFSQSLWAADPSSLNGINHSEMLRMVLGLIIVLVVILALSWIVKRMNGVTFTSTKGFQYMGGMVVGPKEKVMLLKAGTRYLLIGIGSASINLLHDFGEELPEGFDAENKSIFAEVLKSAIGKKK
jgi:flagellar protein FliO/FliZ